VTEEKEILVYAEGQIVGRLTNFQLGEPRTFESLGVSTDGTYEAKSIYELSSRGEFILNYVQLSSTVNDGISHIFDEFNRRLNTQSVELEKQRQNLGWALEYVLKENL